MVVTGAVSFPARYSIGGVLISNATYETATRSIIQAAKAQYPALVDATAVHGLTLAATDPAFGGRLNAFDMLTADGQPVRWGLNLLHQLGMRDRVYGPSLMLRVCEVAARAGLSIYLYGSRPYVLERLVDRLHQVTPMLRIGGYHSPPFRPLTAEEDAADVQRIRDSGARILFVGLGCPLQEEWAYAHRDRLQLPIVCVGAAFDFHARTLPQAPAWMQARGLEWLFRLVMEPRRLWRRYTRQIPIYLYLLAREYAAHRVLRRAAVQTADT